MNDTTPTLFDKQPEPPPVKQVTDFAVHSIESPSEAQEILDKKRTKLSKRCRQVFNLLMTGRGYTTRQLDNLCNMTDSRKRISDLKKINGVLISNCVLVDEDGYKIHQMTPADIEYNKIFVPTETKKLPST